MDSNKEINIYLNDEKNKNQILELASPYEKYIIMMNDTLQGENRELRNQINEQSLHISELENENETYDTSKRYTRGLLKNLVELERLRKNVSDLNKQKNNYIIKNISDYIKNMESEIYIIASIYLSIFFMIYFSYVYSIAENICLFILIFTIQGLNLYMIKNIPFNKNTFEDDNRIKELEELIKKISDSQDFLNEYIDCI
jgi:hypothetical protein